MPTEAENVQYLYLVLTNDGNPNIDWEQVGAALSLNKGAVTKRWSRLKQAMDKGDVPAGTTYQFLWLCVKHNKRDKPPNWIDIAAKCNTTHGAASKRYSRMKKAFEEGVATPTSSPVKTTPSEKKNNILAATSDTPTKRKRRPAKKASSDAVDEAKFEPEVDAEDGEVLDEVHVKPKRARLAKPKPKTKAKGKATIPEPMSESEIEDEDTFFDAVEEKDGKDERVESWLRQTG